MFLRQGHCSLKSLRLLLAASRVSILLELPLEELLPSIRCTIVDCRRQQVRLMCTLLVLPT